MKVKYLFLSMLACGLVAACNNDEVTENSLVEQASGSEGDSYMAVSLVMGGSAGTRAIGNYEAGSDKENTVQTEQAIFYFYDANDKYLTYGTVTGSLEWETSTGNVEKTSNAVVVLGPTESKPSKVLAVLNNGTTAGLQGKNLQEAVAEIVSGDGIYTDENFVMTNSVYMDGSDIVYATEITEDNIKESEEEAKADNAVVQIYVERVAAKVSFDESDEEYELTALTPVLDGEQVSMKVVVDGWCLNAINESSYLVKNLDESWATTEPFSGWNSTTNYRSYWAMDENYNTNSTSGLTYYSWNNATADSEATVYCHENTINQEYAQADGGDIANVTTVLLAAHIETSNDNGDSWTQQDVFKHNGVFYTEDALKALILDGTDYYWYTEEEGNRESLSIDDITFTEPETQTEEPSHVTVEIKAKEGAILVEGATSTTEVNIDDAEIALNASTYAKDVEGYKDGACYYQVPIEHLTSTDENPFYGVVRNHSYKLTLTGISDIGSPVWDKDVVRPIIPGENTYYYISVKLNILSWQVVTQEVSL